MYDTWIHFHGQGALQHQERITDTLRECGVTVSADVSGGPRRAGIIVFSSVDEGLHDLLRGLTVNEASFLIGVSLAQDLASEDPWHLLESGFSDVLTWHDSKSTASGVSARLIRWHAVDELVESALVSDNLIGNSHPWKSLMRRVVEVARFTDASVLIQGESGTGKELVARLIHTLDPRPDKGELVVIDCTTISPELSGSEFFGHERGAFTGAVGPREGAFALADQGSLFLDEVGELPPQLQPQLLRVLQEGTYKRVGGNKWHHTRFRLIAATNRDLAREVREGRFRADLYYRIASWVFRLPSLRERSDDILPLTRHFLTQIETVPESMGLDSAVRQTLVSRDYPGNVRELRQLIYRIGQRHVGVGPITAGDIPEDERPAGDPARGHWQGTEFSRVIRRGLTMGCGLKEIVQCTKDAVIAIAVSEEDGNLQKAAHRLGVTDRTLQMHRANHR